MSGEFKGTPGVWVADKTSRAIGPISRGDDQSYGMVIPVGWVEFDPEIEIQAANQNLLAAAPELLHALQQLIRAAENIGGEHVTGLMDLDNAVMFASIKVAKALGVFKNQ